MKAAALVATQATAVSRRWRAWHCGSSAWLAALPALWLAAAAYAQPVTYRLDPEHCFVHFEVRHFGTSTTRGRFAPFRAEVTLDRSAQRGAVSLRIPTASVSTGLPLFDARLRAADLLASTGHPDAYFVSNNFRFDGDRLTEVRGEFTLRGISQPLALRTLHFACRRSADDGGEVCGGDFEAFFNRSEFGLSFGLPFVADRVRLVVQVEGRRQ